MGFSIKYGTPLSFHHKKLLKHKIHACWIHYFTKHSYALIPAILIDWGKLLIRIIIYCQGYFQNCFLVAVDAWVHPLELRSLLCSSWRRGKRRGKREKFILRDRDHHIYSQWHPGDSEKEALSLQCVCECVCRDVLQHCSTPRHVAYTAQAACSKMEGSVWKYMERTTQFCRRQTHVILHICAPFLLSAHYSLSSIE